MTTKKAARKGAAKKSAKKSAKKGSAKGASKRGRGAGGPFSTFAMHRTDEGDARAFGALREERAAFPGFALTAGALPGLDPETAARQYLEHALASNAVPSFTAPQTDGGRSEFKSLGTETLLLTNTKTVKFRQYYNQIPVYSSLVTVELDEANDCLSINSSLGTPEGVSPVAKLSPADALGKALKEAGTRPSPDVTPRLNYYYDQKAARWRLAYIIEDVPIDRAKRGGAAPSANNAQRPGVPFGVDYVIDAHTGAVVAELSRTHTMAQPEEEDALDDLDRTRRIRFTRQGNGKVLRDQQLNLLTHDFRFGDPDVNENRLPGGSVTNPPAPWSTGAVSAHANAAVVSQFLRQVLQRNNIDNQGGAIVSSVNCVVARESPDGRQWVNAFWTGRRNQMVYGQSVQGARLRSLAISLDIVAHEMFHGVTDNTSRLEYAFQPGALNESYSDIFGILISNADEPNIANWNFQLGEGVGNGGRPFRDLSRPSLFGQPEHMNQFRILPNTRNGDWGGVHINSGIHNFAAFQIMTARDAQGRFLFTPQQLAAIFYIALTQQLSRQSDFTASRRGVVLAARTLLRNEPAASRDAKIAAIERAFDAVGIRAPTN